MKLRLIMVGTCLLAACSGQQNEATAGSEPGGSTTTSTVVELIDSAPTTGAPVSVETTAPPGTATVEEGYCATGTYDLDGAALWAQVAAASAEGGAGQVVSGGVVLDLRADLTALIDFQNWTFRLQFPGESDTVLGVQTGQLTGTWSVDDQGAHTVELLTDTVAATFTLETAQGPIPVPAGDKLVPVGTLDMLADCRTTEVVLLANDVALGTTIEWTFVRRDP